MPVAAFSFSPEMLSTDEQVVFSNSSTDASSWEWDFGDGEGSVEENPSHQYLVLGSYTVTLKATSEKGCVNTTSQTIGIITGAEHSFASVTKAYPNPVTGKIVFIQHPVSPEPITIKLFNAHGELIQQFNAGRNETSSSINVDGLAGGVYLLRIETRDDALSEKIVLVR